MAMNVAPLLRRKEPPPGLSRERAALAEAIAAASAATVRRAGLEKATKAADESVWAAVEAVNTAQFALSTAKREAARYLTELALGNAVEPPLSIKRARVDVADAEDSLEAARAARAALKAQLEEDNNRFDPLPDRVAAAAVTVIRDERSDAALALAARIERLQKELIEAGSALQWLARHGVFPVVEGGATHGRPADRGIRDTLARLETTPTIWTVSLLAGSPPFAVPTGEMAWAGAFEELMRNADAPLPGKDFG